MPREIKILLFAIFCVIGGGSFAAKTIETGSAIQGIVFTLQLFGLIVGITITMLFFMWLGSKIWRE